ncbi:hypothetical protein M9H77_34475 [Catharanthus roseus]|uniref:Uncharacterized protein n=1 Tax=Catharanthus roseus TaxID=4058 RepID=A0ACB9ZLJ0_CATRO|nr:hypothetical protein M9H77_34475 [Catharanthus roseus]
MNAALGLLILPSPPLTTTSNRSINSFKLHSTFLPVKTLNYFSSFHLKSRFPKSNFAGFLVFAAENDNNSNGDNIDDLLSEDEKKRKLNGEKRSNGNGDGIKGNGDGGEKGNGNGNGNGRPRLNLKWIDLLIDPDPDNVVAVGLTGVLAWASVQVLWQLFTISIAIVLAALKYSFIAALLIFILITLL